jgi:hypothetical protein
MSDAYVTLGIVAILAVAAWVNVAIDIVRLFQ